MNDVIRTAVLSLAALGLVGQASFSPAVPHSCLTAEQEEILGHLSIVQLDDGQGGTAKTLRVEGVNLQVVNGLEATNGYPNAPLTVDPFFTVTNGLGNLILGYNELGSIQGDDRTGSHNLVVGQRLSYASFGGLLTCRDNLLEGPYSAITGGSQNRTEFLCSSVSGGFQNVPSEYCTSICGGVGNAATDRYAWVGGGEGNVASGERSSVAGGLDNLASADHASVSGGEGNVASGHRAWVGGGFQNTASQITCSVAGGTSNQATASQAAVCGGRGNTADGIFSTVSGGVGRTVSVENTSGVPQDDWVGGGLWQDG